jgi:hypothetical protein
MTTGRCAPARGGELPRWSLPTPPRPSLRGRTQPPRARRVRLRTTATPPPMARGAIGSQLHSPYGLVPLPADCAQIETVPKINRADIFNC